MKKLHDTTLVGWHTTSHPCDEVAMESSVFEDEVDRQQISMLCDDLRALKERALSGKRQIPVSRIEALISRYCASDLMKTQDDSPVPC